MSQEKKYPPLAARPSSRGELPTGSTKVDRWEAPRPRSNPGLSRLLVGEDYTDEELEFLRAIDRYKRDGRRPHPTWPEVLAVAHALGYRKQEAAPHAPPDAD